MNKKVVILNFSPRTEGNCAKVCTFLQDYYNRTNVYTYTIKDSFRSCADCNYECLKSGPECPALTEDGKLVMDHICSSDLVYYVIPNFCGYPCSQYFAFNERSVGYFHLNANKMDRYMAVRKRFILISNSESEIFRDAMRQQTNEEPEILYLKAGKYGMESIRGDLMESVEARAELLDFLEMA